MYMPHFATIKHSLYFHSTIKCIIHVNNSFSCYFLWEGVLALKRTEVAARGEPLPNCQ